MQRESYPGDELVPEPTDVTTREILIQAPADAIWPWLVQVGYHRGGWYIDAWWDRAINKYLWPLIVPKHARAHHRPNLDHIDPALQGLALGDTVPDGPPGSAWFSVEIFDPPHVLGLVSTTHIPLATPAPLHGTRFASAGSFSWVFVLEQESAHTTRLTLRMRVNYGPPLLQRLMAPLLQITDRLFAGRMLQGIRARAQGLTPGRGRTRFGAAEPPVPPS